jgi:hypothetical protein
MSCAARVLGVPFSRLHLLLLLLASFALLVEGAPIGTTTASAAPAQTARPARQAAVAAVLPPVAQPGAWTATPSRARTVVTAEFRPKVSGRLARLQLRRHGHWSPVDTARLDDDGRVAFTAPTRVSGRPATYRVRATVYGRLPGVRSAPVRADAWGRPAFVEQFEGDALGPAWEHRIQFYNPWGGRSCSKGDPSAVAVGGGALRLSVLADPARTGELCATYDDAGNPTGSFAWRLNGHVSTESSFDFQYGVAAARMKFQRRGGQHAAFWMQPRGLLEHEPTPWGAEIDVIEWYGAGGGRERMATAVHRHIDGGAEPTMVGGPIPAPDRFLHDRDDRWWRGYHVFSVEWTPTEYVFRIDGQETMRTTEGVSHHPEFLILSLLSSDYELGALGGDAHLPQHVDVDWVQVWPLAP